MKINKYPDGTSYVKADVELIGNVNHKITFKINSYEDLWHLNQYVDAFWNFNKQKPTITIPNLIDAQADRRFNEDESFGLKLVCQFLNNMKANFKIFHPHNPEVVEALMDNVEIIDNRVFIKQVLNTLSITDNKLMTEFSNSSEIKPYIRWKNECTNLSKNLILMSSDAGGFKPLIKLCNKIDWQGETYSASKAREFHMGETTLVQKIDRQDFKGRDILIIDDICVYGGTFKNLANMLHERNCGKLYLAVSHMTVQNLGANPVTNYFDKVFTTNSKYDEYYNQAKHPQSGKLVTFNEIKNLEIIKLF